MSGTSQRLAFEHAQWPDNAGLGAIAYGASGDVKRASDRNWMWRKYDEKFGDRYDYRLWRRVAKRDFPSYISEGWGKSYEIAKHGICASDRKHVWGLLAVLGGHFARRGELTRWSEQEDSQIDFNEEQSLELAEVAARLPQIGLLQGFEGECAIIGCLLYDSAQQLRYNLTRRCMTLEEARSYVNNFETLLKAGGVNQQWQPGFEPIYFSFKGRRRRDGIAPWDDHDLSVRMRDPIYNIRGIIRGAVVESQVYDEPLLNKAYLYAISAWRYSRSLNRWQKNWMAQAERLGNSEMTLRAQLVIGELGELRALYRAAQAAYDLGDVVGCGRLSYLLVHQIPDWVGSAAGLQDVIEGWDTYQNETDDKEKASFNARFARLVMETNGYTKVASWAIRQVGLEVDERFTRDRRQNAAQEVAPADRSETADSAKKAVPAAPSKAADSVPPRQPEVQDARPVQMDPLGLLVREHQKMDVRWATLTKHYGFSPLRPLSALQRLNRDLKAHKLPLDSEAEMRDAFGICLRYGYVVAAGQLLKIMNMASLMELADMAHSIKRASQAIPVGIEPKQYANWRKILQDKLAALPLGETDWVSLTFEEGGYLLVLHEILAGRGLSIIRNAGNDVAKILLEKHYGMLAESQLRDLLDTGILAMARGCGTVTLDKVWSWLEQVGKTHSNGLGNPGCVSINRLSENTLGILIISGGRTVAYRRWKCDAPVSDLVNELVDWLPDFLANPDEHLTWPRSLRGLAREIVRKMDPAVGWFILAVPSDLGAIPWQLLFCGVAAGALVSLVPSLSWLVMAAEEGHSCRPGVMQRLSNASNIRALRQRLDADSDKLSAALGSAGVVLGHGVRVPEAPTICFADRPLWVEEWLAIAQHKFCIVHSCSAAKGREIFLGDIGGIPGLVLGARSLCLLAPVTEVSIETAEKLHERLIEYGTTECFGLRYLRAVKDNPSVGLYTLYGLANELVNTTTTAKYSSGTVVEGKVCDLAHDGALIQIDAGIRGFLPVSEISWTLKVHHVNTVLQKGQRVRCIVLSANQEKWGKWQLILSCKRLTDDPWLRIIPERYRPGRVVKGTVMNIADFGVFVQLEEDLTGLLHKNEMNGRAAQEPAKAFTVGENVNVMILQVDQAKHKIALSMKNLEYESDGSRGASPTKV